MICPECGEPLEEVKEAAAQPAADEEEQKKKKKKMVTICGIIIAVILLLAGIGFGIYKLLGDKKPTAIKLDKKELTMKVGDTQVIVPTAEPEGVKATFIFKKKGNNIEVNSGGEVTALKKGEATILVKCEENPDIRAICKVTIVTDEDGGGEPEPTKKPTAIKLDKKELTMKVGDKQVIVPSAEPEDVDATFIFKKEGNNIEVNSAGEVTALKEGEATILVQCEENPDISAVCKITVKKQPVDPGPSGPKSPIERYGNYAGARSKNGLPDGTGKLTFIRPYQLNAEYTAQPGEYIQGIFENGKPSFVTYYQKDGTVVKIKLR